MTGQEEEDLKKLHCWPPPPHLLHPPRLQVAILRKKEISKNDLNFKKILATFLGLITWLRQNISNPKTRTTKAGEFAHPDKDEAFWSW